MATNILLKVSADEVARAEYESQLIFEADQRGRIRQAKDEGREEGREEAKKEYENEIKKLQVRIKELEARK
jgi:flagellar biosynthesis/type III secretory pathway protein FliH